jgi:hypothetical protein
MQSGAVLACKRGWTMHVGVGLAGTLGRNNASCAVVVGDRDSNVHCTAARAGRRRWNIHVGVVRSAGR